MKQETETAGCAFMFAVGAGVFVATALPTLIFFVLGTLKGGEAAGLYAVGAFLMSLVVSAPVITISALVVGVPTTALLKRTGFENALSYTLVGATFGLIVGGALHLVTRDPPYAVASLLIGPFAGAVTGCAWWRSYRRVIAHTGDDQISSTSRP